MLCTKLDVEYDRQATVVGGLLTTLAVTILFQRLVITFTSGDIQVLHLFDKYFPASRDFLS